MWGKLLNVLLIIVFTLLTRSLRIILCEESLRLTILLSARNIFIDLINTMINTAVMVRMETGLKIGILNDIGVTIANYEALCSLDKLTLFIIYESKKLNTIFSNTATLDINFFA